MNKELTANLVKHIFHIVGAHSGLNEFHSTFLQRIKSPDFLLDKKLAFELDDGDLQTNSIWSFCTQIEKEVIQLLLCDVSVENQTKEYVLAIKYDKLEPQCIYFSFTEKSFEGSMYFFADKKWISLDIPSQLQLTIGIEQLNSVPTIWKKNEDYSGIYQSIIGFLNYLEVLNA